MDWVAVAAIGVGVGFLGGLFGKGGSAIATPLLHAAGIPAIVAVAAPLPATIPSTAVASLAYWRENLVDRKVLTWSLAWGIPATAAGAFATRWIGGESLVTITDAVIAALGLRFLVAPGASKEIVRDVEHEDVRLAAVAVVVGVSAGLLANSGGFLLAPLYLVVLRMPIKNAFASSLAVAAFLAVPGTIVHWALGHIDWSVVAVFGLTSIPLSYVGARVALRTNPEHLERIYGGALLALGAWFLVHR
ncbi:MAG TPA: sulfite exporter TauE/SafE family protein [Acidimicrobiales bacterium]|jgi:uncharacterized membrane protein YfcA|nr:sulfite exporter TauE/SafE family protein [Acidimicrobiales bacterium]